MGEHQLDCSEVLEGLRCHTTGWLHTAREEAIRDLRDTTATAKALEDLSSIAAAAVAGALSDDQLTNVVKLADPADPADPGSDTRWAKEAPSWSLRDLAQEVRTRRTPTMAAAAARRAARELRWWWRKDTGMLDRRFSLPDVDGAVFESVQNEMIEKMKPAKGQHWKTRERGGADALVDLVRNYVDVNAVSGPSPHLIVQVPLTGPGTVAGIALPDPMVEALRAQARIEPVLVGDDGEPVAVGRITSVLSEKTKRVVRLRDGKCRFPGCDRREGLHIHHLWPKGWGGTDEPWNLAAVCTGASTDHHPPLAPQGPSLLLGNPNHPAGLTLVHRDDLPTLAAHRANEARAGPDAA